MKLNLIDSFVACGVLTDLKPLVKEYNEIEVPCDGVLVLTTIMPNGTGNQKGFKSRNGIVTINDHEIVQGTSRVEFTRHDGASFKCGEIHRNGRFVHYKSNSDELLISLAVAYLEQQNQIKNLSKEISELKTRYGISII